MSSRGFHRGLRAFWYVVLFFLYAPLAVVALYSFNSINSSAVFAGVSLRWYAELFSDQIILHIVYNSLTLAITSSVIATVIGTLLGYGMYTYRHRRLGWLVWVIYLPIVMPDIVYGISQMTFFTSISSATGLFDLGLGTMIIAHISFQVPFVALLIYSRLVGLDAQLFEACHDLYAKGWQRAWYFIVPTLRPAIVSGFFLAFTLSIDDFVISFFTSGPESTTLPIFIWSAIKKGITPEVNAIATLIIGAVFAAAVVALAFTYVRSARPRAG
ncbi:ABC transporter permease [Salinisphaera sp.]|uniref:ABC transporter permease n=1 Tax=Salinisphaera sp. TaxID=1914330 RepID=UPI002D79C4A6|nr:ABC transporter permease [Salinisphaera sp.]HET7315624.1 ABC transporter permease [Salinisphaera sp.]